MSNQYGKGKTMTATTTNPAMLAAISADLDDDTRRLAYADWLDENGDSDRAELIRVQCQLAPRRDVVAACGPDLVFTPQIRERELIAAHPEWTQWPCLLCKGRLSTPQLSDRVGRGNPPHTLHVVCESCRGTGDLLKDRRITWDRGWLGWVHVERVSELVATEVQRAQYETGPFYTAEHTRPTPLLSALAQTPPWGVPLRGVIVKELQPQKERDQIDRWWWWRGTHEPHGLQSAVFNCLPAKPQIHGQNGVWYPNEQAAIRAAAAAFLEFGRRGK